MGKYNWGFYDKGHWNGTIFSVSQLFLKLGERGEIFFMISKVTNNNQFLGPIKTKKKSHYRCKQFEVSIVIIYRSMTFNWLNITQG